ncbi:MAG TPA: peroxiredoxin [Candidatus Xenobia bacterium]|jgi:peroxiredoxin (alkyl hydroperoxide reductase subunit C)
MTLVGKKAPDFHLESTKDPKSLNEPVRLADYGGKWLVVMFYPMDFTFVCPTELLSFSDRVEDFHKAGAEIIGVSTDSKFTHRAWLNTPRDENGVQGMRYPLAADPTHSMSRNYGVLIEDKGVALRGLFIIDPNGVVQYEVVHALNVGRSVDEVLRVLQGLQTGGLCPSDWRPGQKLLVAK